MRQFALRVRSLPALCLAAALMACGESDADASVDALNFSIESTLALGTCDGIADNAFLASHPRPVSVSASQVSKDTLNLAVQFAGGCGAHLFSLCWNGANGFLESNPVQTELRLLHTSDDTCNATMSGSLAFDLRELEAEFARAYPQGDTLLLRLGGSTAVYAIDGTAEQNSLSESCARGGCSSEVCASASSAAELVTTCEFQPEYACLDDAVCERQTDGRCGWTYSDEALQCLNDV
ncbi:MAG: hypothetical protein AAFQ82_02435 [Myxococcota bacterium]